MINLLVIVPLYAAMRVGGAGAHPEIISDAVQWGKLDAIIVALMVRGWSIIAIKAFPV